VFFSRALRACLAGIAQTKQLGQLQKEFQQMKIDLSKVTAATAKTTNAEQAAIVAFNGISGQLKDISAQLTQALADNDPTATAAAQAAVDGLADSLDQNADALAAAVVANTPSGGAVPDQPLA
jgi:hypothetical protein